VADLQKTVEIIFGGRNDLSQVIGNVERSLDSLNTASQPFADMADNVLRAEVAVLALGVAFAGLSIEQAGTFGDQFAEITTLIDANVSDLSGYRQAILDYATGSTQSLDSITGAVYSAISAGVDYTDALGVMSSAEQLAVAGKADLNSTLVALASVMNAYGASTEEASDYSDTFFTTVKMGQTTIPELAASLSQVTSTAVAAGVPFDELSAAVAALTAAGMPTSQAITSIKAALSNIIKPSSDAQAAAAALGIEFNATALKTQGLGGFMQTLYEATGGNIETMSQLFGSTEALGGVMALAADKSSIFANSLEAMETRSGATAVAFEKMVDNFSLNNQRLVNNIQSVLIGVGAPLLDEYRGVIDSLIANLQGIGTALNAGSLDGLIGIFESALNDIEGLLSGVAEVLPQALAGIDWSSLSGSLDNLKESVGDAFSAIFGDIDLSTVDGVESAIQTVVDLLSGLSNLSSGVIDGMRPLFVFLGEVAEKFTEMEESGQLAAGQILGFGKSVNEISGFLSGATSALGGMSNGLLLLGGSSVLNAVTSLVTRLGPGAGLLGTIGSLGPAIGQFAAVVGAGTGGWMLGTEINEEINQMVDHFTGGDNDTLGGLIYDWIHGGDANIEAEVKTITATIETIPDIVAIVARDVAEIGWEFDADGNVSQFSEEIKANLDTIASAGNELENALNFDAGTVSGTFNIVSSAADKTSASLDTTAEKSEKALLALETLASNERINSMELMVDLNIAELESDTKKAVAAIEGLGTTISSSNDLVGSLAGSLGSVSDFGDKWLIEDMLDDANDRANDAAEKQLDLIDAQIDNMEAKTRALKSGDALIKISGDGLAPELEAFMWKILEAIQVRAAEDQSAFLLGV